MFMDYSCDFTSNSTKDFFNYPEDLRSHTKGASGWGQHTLRGARVTVPLQRRRITFTKAQLGDLETAFSLTQYPDASLKQTLSSITGLPESRIQVWFQNRRARYFRNKKQLQDLAFPPLPEAPKNPSLKQPAPHASPNLPSTYHSPNLPTEYPSPNHPSPNLPSTNLPFTYPSPKLPSEYPSPNLPSLDLPSTCPSPNLPPTCPSPNLSSTYPSHNVSCAYSAPDIPSVTLLPYTPQPFTAAPSLARGSVSAPECMSLTAPAAAMTPAHPGTPAECKSFGGRRSGEGSVLQCENKEQRRDITDWEAPFYRTCQTDTHTPEQREGRGVYRVKGEDYTHLTTPTQTLPLHYLRHGALVSEELDILSEFSGHVYEDFGLPDLEVSAAFIDYLLHD